MIITNLSSLTEIRSTTTNSSTLPASASGSLPTAIISRSLCNSKLFRHVLRLKPEIMGTIV
ncbi:hypothetical protein BGX38DRAFT_1176416, partial [Terfezia claveryi]